MKNLNEKQLRDIKTLVRLGDSLELAIKTVLKKPEVDVEFYKSAYEI